MLERLNQPQPLSLTEFSNSHFIYRYNDKQDVLLKLLSISDTYFNYIKYNDIFKNLLINSFCIGDYLRYKSIDYIPGPIFRIKEMEYVINSNHIISTYLKLDVLYYI